MSKKRRNETEEERKERKRAKKEAKKQKKEQSEKKKEDQALEAGHDVRRPTPSEEPPLEESAFYRKKIELVVSLYPSALGNVLKHLQESLHAFLLKYSNGVGGIILGFDGLAIKSDTKEPTGRILNELPYIHYTVACNALVFNPTVGSKLTGYVNECFPSHVGMLVYNYFNAMVSAAELRTAGYSFDSNEQEWIHDDTKKVVTTLDRIDFVVNTVHECGGTISMEGSNPFFNLK